MTDPARQRIARETKDEYLADLERREPPEIVDVVRRFIEHDEPWPYELGDGRVQCHYRNGEHGESS